MTRAEATAILKLARRAQERLDRMAADCPAEAWPTIREHGKETVDDLEIIVQMANEARSEA